MSGNAKPPEASQELWTEKGTVRAIRLQVTWGRYGDAIERAVVSDLPQGAAARVVWSDKEIQLSAADVYWRGDSETVDALFAMLERSFRMAGAGHLWRPYAKVPVGLVTDTEDRLAGFAFFPEDSQHEAM
jgi:hypothetical protein